MQLNSDQITNKQRILIGGNIETKEVFNLVKSILQHIKKPADFVDLNVGKTELSDAPIVIMIGGDELENGKAVFQNLDIHILLLHKLTDSIPKGYDDFNAYVDQYEQLADSLPKAGTYIYNELDDVALMMGKKEREDIKNIEYNSLQKDDTGSFDPNIAAAAKALLKRIGVSSEQFQSGLKTL